MVESVDADTAYDFSFGLCELRLSEMDRTNSNASSPLECQQPLPQKVQLHIQVAIDATAREGGRLIDLASEPSPPKPLPPPISGLQP